MSHQDIRCEKCASNRGWSLHYREPTKTWRFLWWSRRAQPERMEGWCLQCGYVQQMPLYTPKP